MVFIFNGIFYSLWLALIGVFIYMGAGSEKQKDKETVGILTRNDLLAALGRFLEQPR